MGILGILTCEILELEFARLLAADKDLSRITVLEDERSLLISTPIMSLEEMKQNSKDFNELFGLRTEVCTGTLGILQRTWETAKKRLASIND